MIIIALKTTLKNYVHNKKKMSFLKISDPVKRDLIVKEYLEIQKNIRDNLLSERTGNNNNKPIFQSFINLLQKRKKLQRGRLRKGLDLLQKAERTYRRLLHFHLCNLSEKHPEQHRKKKSRNISVK